MTIDEDRIAITRNFARWAATRANQRGIGGFKSEPVFAAWEKSGLANELEEAAPKKWKSIAYDRSHQTWCNRLKRAIRRELENADRAVISFGIAAKFINVYTKVAFTIPHLNQHTSFIAVLHPPIDTGLMDLLRAKGFDRFPQTPWTKFNSSDYKNALKVLREANKSDLQLWRLEREWTGV